MSKKAKTEVDEKSAVIITDAVLAENQAKLDSYEKSIKAVQERRRKVIIDTSSTPTISSHSFTAVRRDRHFSML